MSTVAVVVATIPDRQHLLARATGSIATQTRPADQVIVEHDYWRTGAAATRNRALAKVDTEWVAWLDDDDELLPNHLDALTREAERTGADLVYPVPSMASGHDPTAVSVNGLWVKPWGVQFGPEQEHHLRTQGSFIPVTHLVRTSSVREAGGFPEGRALPTGRYQGEDERYLVALLDAGARFAHLNTVTWLWHGGQIGRAS